METRQVAIVSVTNEQSGQRGWVFDAHVESRGRASDHRISLSWADHDYWCHGAHAPARVIEELLKVVDELGGLELLPARFDASVLRRRFPGIDDAVQARL